MRKWVMAGVLALAPVGQALGAENGEIELHIETRGAVMADYAMITHTLFAQTRTKAEGEKEIAAQVAKLRTALARAGVPAEATKLDPLQFSDSTEAPQNVFGFAQAVSVPAYSSANPDDSAEAAAAEAAASVSADTEQAPVKRKRPRSWNVETKVTIRVDDLRLYPDVRKVLGFGTRGTDRNTEFRFRDPASVHAAAVAQALAKARSEADLHAKAAGYHVVRMVRLSNRESPVSVPEIVNFIGQMDGEDMWRTPATHTASLAVDFAIAPD